MDRATSRVLSLFQMICEVPRPSGREEKIRERLVAWATERGLETRTDSAGNLLVTVPPTAGAQNAPVLVVQGHMDMVGERRSGSTHCFETDPIRTHMEGEWLVADETTLGADNGIALALALSLAEDDTILRPPLELLFTVDEETGLTGASRLSAELVTGRILINLDSEDEGRFTVGCAGGVNVAMSAAVAVSTADAAAVGERAWRLAVSGLAGGHSGVDIHEGRANALCILARLLREVATDSGFRLLAIDGGRAHNAIPREATAVCLLSAAGSRRLEAVVAEVLPRVRGEFAATDPGLVVELSPVTDPAGAPLPCDRSRALVALLADLPHGPLSWSDAVPGLVETSANLAGVRLTEDRLSVLVSLRGSNPARLEEAARRTVEQGAGAEMEVSREAAYPGWEPDLKSELLQRAQRVYRGRFGHDPVTEVVHAGLECGVIGARIPGMEMISVGPTIRGAHSPDERLHIPSVTKVRQFLVDLLRDYGASVTAEPPEARDGEPDRRPPGNR